MKEEYDRYLIRALVEIDFVIDDIKYRMEKMEDVEYTLFKDVVTCKKLLLDSHPDLASKYFLEKEKWK